MEPIHIGDRFIGESWDDCIEVLDIWIDEDYEVQIQIENIEDNKFTIVPEDLQQDFWHKSSEINSEGEREIIERNPTT